MRERLGFVRWLPRKTRRWGVAVSRVLGVLMMDSSLKAGAGQSLRSDQGKARPGSRRARSLNDLNSRCLVIRQQGPGRE